MTYTGTGGKVRPQNITHVKIVKVRLSDGVLLNKKQNQMEFNVRMMSSGLLLPVVDKAVPNFKLSFKYWWMSPIRFVNPVMLIQVFSQSHNLDGYFRLLHPMHTINPESPPPNFALKPWISLSNEAKQGSQKPCGDLHWYCHYWIYSGLWEF